MSGTVKIAEIAEALGITRRAALKRADKQDWPWEPLPGSARAKGYLVDRLPEDVRAKVLLQLHPSRDTASDGEAAPDAANTDAQAEEEAWLEGLWERFERKPGKHKAIAQSRLEAVERIDRLLKAGVKKGTAYTQVAWVHDVSVTSVRNWWAKVERQPRQAWLALLAPEWRGGGRTAECDPRAWEQYKADWLRLQRPSHASCYDRLQRVAADEGWVIPDARTLQRWCEQLDPLAVTLAREGRKALDRKLPSQRRSRAGLHAMQVANADCHTVDIWVKWPDGDVLRPTLVAFQDVYSSYALSWRIAKAPNAETSRLALGDMVENYGIPEHVHFDNGREFTAKMLTGQMEFRRRFKVKREEVKGCLTALGVHVHFCEVEHGQAKPIERMFGTLIDYIAKHPSFAGAYTGPNPKDKPEDAGSRAIPLHDFVAVVEEEIARHNAKVGRRTEICGGVKSFEQAFSESYQTALIKKASPSQRRLFLLAAEGVKVRRDDGMIHLFGNRYWSEACARLAGQHVTVRFDPQDLHAGLHLYRGDGRYVGFVTCTADVGFEDTDQARTWKKLTQERRKAVRRQLDIERRMGAAAVGRAVSERRLAEPPRPESKVVALHTRGNAALAANAEAESQTEEQEDVAVRALRGLQLIQGGGDGAASD